MPHPTLTAIAGTPDFTSVRLLKKECFANAASVESSLTAPDLGHAVLVIGDNAYNALATRALQAANPNAQAFVWAAPVRPPAQPELAGANSNHARAIASDTWKRLTTDWNHYTKVQSTLKKQIIEAVPAEFISSLSDDTTGFAAITPLQLINHLANYYGTVTRADIDANLTALEAPWEPCNTMEGLWTRCTACEHIAQAGGEPIQLSHKMRIMLKVLTSTGVFHLDIRDWNNKPDADRTWPNFCTFFANANRERCANLTAGSYRHQATAAVVKTNSNATSNNTNATSQATNQSNDRNNRRGAQANAASTTDTNTASNSDVIKAVAQQLLAQITSQTQE